MDAEGVESLKVFRKEGRIEIVVNVTKEKDNTLKGILVRNVVNFTQIPRSYYHFAGGSTFRSNKVLSPLATCVQHSSRI